MSNNPNDAQLLQLLNSTTPQTVAEVVQFLKAIDDISPSNDGLKWFNVLYLMTTQAVLDEPPANGWQNPAWLARLDVVFANLYSSALRNFLTGGGPIPSSWEVLFEHRNAADVQRIQFALAGMNAHINRDLALALIETSQQMGFVPAENGPEHQDFEHVNKVLEDVLPEALVVLADGHILGELAQDTGTIGRLLAIWNVRKARELAWDFAEVLRGLSGFRRRVALALQDSTTGALGRSLLFPVH
jgi:Family of unknown function (DUF5995)